MKLRKILSSVVAGAIALSAMTFSASAEGATVIDFEDGAMTGISMKTDDGGDKSVLSVVDYNGSKQLKVDIQKDSLIPKVFFDVNTIVGANNMDKVAKVTFDVTMQSTAVLDESDPENILYDVAGWQGGAIGAQDGAGGSLPWTQAPQWTIEEYSESFKTATLEIDLGGATFTNGTEGSHILVMKWANESNPVDMYIDNVKFFDADGNAMEVYPAEDAAEEEAPAEDATEEEAPAEDAEAEEEAPAEDAEAEEEVEEDAAEEEAEEDDAALETEVEIGDGSFAGTKYLVNNEVGKATLFITSEEGKREPNLSGDAGIDQTSIYGITFYVDFVDEEVADEATWIGGGIGANSNSTGWLQKEWGRAEKEFIADLENGTITMFGDAPIFAADDTYCQLWLQTWGGTVTVNDADLLDADGNIIAIDLAVEEDTTVEEEAPEVEEDEAPATGDVDASTDSSKGSPDTGVEDVAVVAGLAIVAAGAVLVSKKRK